MSRLAERDIILALRENRPGDAARLAVDLLNADPANLLALQARAQALLMLKRPDEVVGLLERAKSDTLDPGLAALLSRALNDLGRDSEAIEILMRVIRRRPQTPQPYLELANLLASRGRLAEAIEILGSARDASPESAAIRIGLGYLYLKQNNRPAARALFEAAYAEAPMWRDAIVALATIQTHDGEFGPAEALYRQALNLRPDDSVSRINLAKCLLESGARAQGEAALRQVASTNLQAASSAIAALAHTTHGRAFLRPSDALNFLRRPESE